MLRVQYAYVYDESVRPQCSVRNQNQKTPQPLFLQRTTNERLYIHPTASQPASRLSQTKVYEKGKEETKSKVHEERLISLLL